MSVQHVRVELARILGQWLEEDGWIATTDTTPAVSSRTIKVGHARNITPQTLAAFRADLLVQFFVNEGDDAESVDRLYELLSPGERSVHSFLVNHPTFVLADSPPPASVAPRDEGPTRFLVADLIVPAVVVQT